MNHNDLLKLAKQYENLMKSAQDNTIKEPAPGAKINLPTDFVDSTIRIAIKESKFSVKFANKQYTSTCEPEQIASVLTNIINDYNTSIENTENPKYIEQTPAGEVGATVGGNRSGKNWTILVEPKLPKMVAELSSVEAAMRKAIITNVTAKTVAFLNKSSASSAPPSTIGDDGKNYHSNIFKVYVKAGNL